MATMQKLNSLHFMFRPYGWKGKWDLKKNKALITKVKKPEGWPKRVMSYELWVALTGYDNSQDDGGEVFQQLVQWLLTEGSAGSNDYTLTE